MPGTADIYFMPKSNFLDHALNIRKRVGVGAVGMVRPRRQSQVDRKNRRKTQT